MLVAELVNRALYLGKIVSRVFDEPTQTYSADALRWLNGILAELGMTGREIPYITTYEFPTIVGQESYDVPGLSDCMSVTFTQGEVRYALQRVYNTNFYGMARVNSINSLMFKYYVQRIPIGSRIGFYFYPSNEFIVQVRGKFTYVTLTYDTELNDLVDLGTQDFFMYKLAQRMCSWEGISFSPDASIELARLEHRVRSMNSPDITFMPRRILAPNNLLNWGQINFARGWDA